MHQTKQPTSIWITPPDVDDKEPENVNPTVHGTTMTQANVPNPDQTIGTTMEN